MFTYHVSRYTTPSEQHRINLKNASMFSINILSDSNTPVWNQVGQQQKPDDQKSQRWVFNNPQQTAPATITTNQHGFENWLCGNMQKTMDLATKSSGNVLLATASTHDQIRNTNQNSYSDILDQLSKHPGHWQQQYKHNQPQQTAALPPFNLPSNWPNDIAATTIDNFNHSNSVFETLDVVSTRHDDAIDNTLEYYPESWLITNSPTPRSDKSTSSTLTSESKSETSSPAVAAAPQPNAHTQTSEYCKSNIINLFLTFFLTCS